MTDRCPQCGVPVEECPIAPLYKDAGVATRDEPRFAPKPERRESISVEEALAVTITLFKECQAERDRYRIALERIRGRPMSYATAKRIADEALKEGK